MRRGVARAVGLTMIEVLVAITVMVMMLASVWSSFRGTLDGMAASEKIQDRYSTLRSGISRMSAEISMAYLSFDRPSFETKHYTLFEGRDSFGSDSLTFSAFAHLRMRKDANESDQSVIQYFMSEDPEDRGRNHLYRRESKRLMGDLPEKMQEFDPAFVLIEDVVSLEFKYWDQKNLLWRDEWATIRMDMQPDRLPQRVMIKVGILDEDGDKVFFTTQTILFMQEKIDLGKTKSQ